MVSQVHNLMHQSRHRVLLKSRPTMTAAKTMMPDVLSSFDTASLESLQHAKLNGRWLFEKGCIMSGRSRKACFEHPPAIPRHGVDFEAHSALKAALLVHSSAADMTS